MPIAVDFSKIRAHNQSQNLGFEELCCQLAGLEPRPKGATFLRKGRGSDQGVECFVTLPNGDQVAWQAKYFTEGFGDDQVRNLSKSLERALEAHPRLVRYVVCLNIDLSGGRVKRNLNQLQRYERWRAEQIEGAKSLGRALEIELWSATEIRERLTRDTPLYAGKLRYWFDTTRLTSEWFEARFVISKANLGERYTPESHVDLPIQRALQAIVADQYFAATARGWSARISSFQRQLASASLGTSVRPASERISASLNGLMDRLDTADFSSGAAPALDVWAAAADQASKLVLEALGALASGDRGARSNVSAPLYDLYSTMQDIKDSLVEAPWKLLAERKLLVTGPAGIGKSHLVAEFGAQQLAAEKPFVLVLSQTLADSDPWTQILQQLGLAGCSSDEFLGALDSAAEAKDTRAVVAIDALNEGHGARLWRDRLAGFVKGFEAFPRVALVLTLRSTYDRFFPTKGLPRIAHRGFAGHASAAAKAYLDRRGIQRTTSPNLLRDFENPLFLRTCCDFLDRKGLKSIPKGLSGVTSVFDFYLQAVASKVEDELGLDPHRSLAKESLDAFVAACADPSRNGLLGKREAMELFESFLPSQGLAGRSLFAAFVSEGVVAVDLVEQGDGGAPAETARPMFERFSDHLIAKRLLDEHLDVSDPVNSFKNTVLSQYVTAAAPWEFAGVVEALAIQIPERCELEILDVADDSDMFLGPIVEAFTDSLVSRDQRRFTAHTLDWVVRLEESLSTVSVFGALVGVAAEPDNAFNAMELHRRLMPLSMPGRDATWSIHVARDDLQEGGSIESLVDWAWEVRPDEVDARRRLLASIALTWLFTTSNRAVRDLATKGLVRLLSTDLGGAVELLRLFEGVNDPYVVERLLAACYGAALQGLDAERLPGLASEVWAQYYERGAPPVHMLARDYALGILEYVDRFSTLPLEVDLKRARGPFATDWPLEAVTEAQLLKYRVGGPNGYRDAISSSTANMGDFKSYSVRSAVNGWTNLPRLLAGETTKQVFDAWYEAFEDAASAEQVEAYVEILLADEEYRQAGLEYDWLDARKREERDAAWEVFTGAVARFVELLSPAEQAEFELFASHFLHESTRMKSDRVGAQEVNETEVANWVCWRAHELGWNAELFEEFERSSIIFRERMGTHRVERVGKKYQRIALAEALARMSDHLVRNGDEGELVAYGSTPYELSMRRDIDPSLLVKKSKETGWEHTPRTWWTPCTVELRAAPVALHLAWLDSGDVGFANGAETIDVVDPRTRSRWLVLNSFSHWSISRRANRVYPQAFTRITCFLTGKGNGLKLISELLAKVQGDDNRLGENRHATGFLGEHGWREDAGATPPLRTNTFARMNTPSMTTSVRLTAESNTKDNSILENFSLDLPSAWLVSELKLRLHSGHGSEWVDAAGDVRFADPSLKERGASAGLVDRELFLRAMHAAGLEPVWLVAGEKNVYGPDVPTSGFGGRVTYVVAYRMVDGELQASDMRVVKDEPTKEQLQALFHAESHG
jgi:hypothetical protein